jgi:hypothetical protein
MSAPTKSQTCQRNSSYCKFGSETLLKLLSVFEDQIEGVMQSDDIEYIHKMRVISRRLRAALPHFRFCFPGKKFKEWASQLKKVTRLLADSDGLDHTHDSNVKSLNIKVNTKRIIAACVSETEPNLEEQAFNNKKDLFEKVFAIKMVLLWKRQ